MSTKAYLNGQLIDVDAPAVTIANPSFLHGVGLFETLRAYQGKPFRLEQHIDRLQRSAAHFNMLLGKTLEHIPHAIEQVLQANDLSDARLRFMVAPSSEPDQPEDAMLLVTAQALAGYPQELYAKGMMVHACTQYRQSRHDLLAGHKTSCYFPRLVALRDAQERGCGEALLFTPENLLAEGCISNVFIVKANQLRTPPIDTPVLPGVTRATVIELANDNEIPCVETPCTIDDLLDADEVFITNAAMEVMPVTRIEQRVIANEQPGLITQQLASLYAALTTKI